MSERRGDPVVAGVRLIPRWYAATVVTVLVALTLLFVALAATRPAGDRLGAVAAWGLALATGLLLVAAVSALARPRRPREPATTEDGVRVYVAPAATVWPLVGAWLLLLVVAGAWVVQAATGLDAIASPGFALVAVLGAIASLPDLARLLTGRLHRWRLELGHDGLSYRGYRSEETWLWSTVHGARVQSRGPAGVVVDVKGSGADQVIPIAAFDVPAEQLVREIEDAKAAARR